jgi:hypothetical protein
MSSVVGVGVELTTSYNNTGIIINDN